MQFLKSKFSQLKQYSKNIIGKKNRDSTSGKDLLELLLKGQSDTYDREIYGELAKISKEGERTTDIPDFIMLKIEQFKYQSKSIRQTFKLMAVTIYLLKNGNSQLVIDLKNNIDLIHNMQNLDSKHFQSITHKNAKLLDYQIESIKQRAKFVQMLISDPDLLEKERYKAAQEREAEPTANIAEDIGQTSVGLKISTILTKSPNESTLMEKEDAGETTCHQLSINMREKKNIF